MAAPTLAELGRPASTTAFRRTEIEGWHFACLMGGMAPLCFLLLAVLCGMIGRALLVKAAFGVSKKWGFGVFFPLGPLFFRISHPDDAGKGRGFRLATLPCMFLYVMTSPEILPSTRVGLVRMGPPERQYYALAAGSYSLRLPGFGTEAAAPAQLSVENRRAANDREFQRLRGLSEQLRIRKRDLLNSDTEGARIYNQMANDYNAALDKYNDEKFSLTLLSSTTALAGRPGRP